MQIQLMTAVRKGAALLDEKRPGWRDELRGKGIQPTSWNHDILGHLWGHTETGALALGICETIANYDQMIADLGNNHDGPWKRNWQILFEHGFHNFNPERQEDEWDEATFVAAWQDVINSNGSVKLEDDSREPAAL